MQSVATRSSHGTTTSVRCRRSEHELDDSPQTFQPDDRRARPDARALVRLPRRGGLGRSEYLPPARSADDKQPHRISDQADQCPGERNGKILVKRPRQRDPAVASRHPQRLSTAEKLRDPLARQPNRSQPIPHYCPLKPTTFRGMHPAIPQAASSRDNRHRPLSEQHWKLCQELRGHSQFFGVRRNFA